jgi:molybdenum cofactor cytidylyltransferase
MVQTGKTAASLQLVGIILAAGASTRFGSPKQAADIGGETMIALAVRRATSQCAAGVIVVAGASYDEFAPLLDDLPVRVIRNHQWREGMSSSIRSGMAGVSENSAGVLLMLCDQPAVTAEDLSCLTSTWRRAPRQIAAARYAGILGVPAIFPPQYWQQLRDLKGQGGAKQIILAAKAVSAVDLPAAAIDIDTPEQLDQLC